MSEHKEHRIYDECGHDHREGDPGTVDVRDVGICCEDGYMYSLCEVCHTHDGECHEDSPDEQAWPCEVQQGLTHIKELEEALHEAIGLARLPYLEGHELDELNDLEALAGKEAKRG